MAQFNTDVQPVQSPMSPTGGVQDNSVASALGSTGNVLSGLSDSLFGARAVQARKAIDKGNENSYIASYEQQQLKIANAVDQGGMSPDEARMRMRANYSKALSNFHGDPDDLAAAHARIVNTSGLGKVIETGNKQYQQEDATIDATMKAGWTSPDKSREEQLLDASHYQQYQMAKDQLGAQQQQIELQRGQIGLQSDKVQLGTARISQQSASVNLQSSRLGLLEKQQEFKSRAALGQAQNEYNHKFQGDLDIIRGRFDNHQIDAKQATMMIQNTLSKITESVGTTGFNAGSDYTNNMLTPMKMRADNMLKYVSGELDGKLLDSKNHNALAVQTAVITGDPEAAQVAAASDLFKNAPFAVQKAAGDKLLSILKRNGTAQAGTDTVSGTKPVDPFSHDDTEKAGYKNYLDTLKSGMAGSLSGVNNNPESTDAEIKTNLSNVLRGVDTFKGETNAKDYNDVVDFLADPQFGQYISKHPNVSQDVATKAKETLQDKYENTVLPLLATEYNKTTADMTRKVDDLNPFAAVPDTQHSATQKDIAPTWNGSGVSFTANDAGNYDAVKRARQLNKDVSPILNKLVRMSAHLNGNMDYKATWENRYAAAFTPKVSDNGNGE